MMLILEWQVRRNASDAAVKDLLRNVSTHLTNELVEKLLSRDGKPVISLFKLKKKLQKASPYNPVEFDCCPSGCIACTNQHKDLRICACCSAERCDARGLSRKKFKCYPTIPRLEQHYCSPERWNKMLHRHKKTTNCNLDDSALRDYYDGSLYRRADSLFKFGKNDVLCAFALDGKLLFKSIPDKSVWVLLLVNLNLPPHLRCRVELMEPVGIIPGPKEPKDIFSFLAPLIDEFKILEEGVVMRRDGEGDELVRAFILFVTGDLPALKKSLLLKGHNGTAPCRLHLS